MSEAFSVNFDEVIAHALTTIFQSQYMIVRIPNGVLFLRDGEYRAVVVRNATVTVPGDPVRIEVEAADDGEVLHPLSEMAR